MFLSSLRALPICALPLFVATTLVAQGDNCTNALTIANPADFCSPDEAANNQNATASSQPKPACFGTSTHDVWFQFTAVATEMVAIVNGESTTPGGTLRRPAIALYEGTCPNGLTLLDCAQSGSEDVAEVRHKGLTPGVTYYLRVDGSNRGTFQYCLRNFFFGGGVSGDCPKAVVLCDKSPFNVQSVTGPGQNDLEMQDADCFDTGIPDVYELNSTWYVWTAANNGTLTFTLTPNKPGDDLDFVVYRLPNGPTNCTGKIVERCMASGADDIFPDAACTGPTGLNTVSTDISEPPGCPFGSDAFLRALNMTAGTTYALVVNNFSESGNGFQITWGGTGQFRGPVAGIRSSEADNKICAGASLVLSDSSSFMGGSITAWEWNFGQGASPATATTAGPHTVSYQTPGTRTVTLKVKTSNGCEVSTTRQIVVEDCCPLNVIPKVAPGCTTSAVNAVVENSVGNVEIRWSNGQTGPFIAGLTPGNYSVTVSDASGCRDSAAFVVANLPPLEATLSKTEDCKGGSASLTLKNDNPPVFYRWSNGATTATVQGLAPGDYTVTVTDSKGCEDTAQFRIQLSASFSLNVATTATCLIGSATATASSNATPPIVYAWSNGATATTVDNLMAGTYSVTASDAKGCADTVTFDIRLLPPLEVKLAQTATCLVGSAAVVLPANAVTPVTYAWSDGTANNATNNLLAGPHRVTVTDAKGCADTVAFNVTLLPPLEAKLNKTETCLAGSASVALPSNAVAPVVYAWSNGVTAASVNNLANGSYSVIATDANGCADTLQFSVQLPQTIQTTATTIPGCPGDGGATAILRLTGGTAPFTVDWSNGFDGDTLRDLKAGTYTATVQDAQGCTTTAVVEVKSPTLFSIGLSNDTTIAAGGKATLTVTSPLTGLNATWSGGGQSFNGNTIAVEPKDTTVYTVVATLNNCRIVDSVQVNVEYMVFEMPNAFTPNGDDTNEKFGPVLSGYALVQLQVWSRWGGLIFDEPTGTWDGTVNGEPAPSDVYVYRVIVRRRDGLEVVRKGDVTLIR